MLYDNLCRFVKGLLGARYPAPYIRAKFSQMAKQCQPIGITGTKDHATFYKMEGKYYVRMKSSLTRERVLKHAAFRRTREHAATLGEASQIASKVYRLMKKEFRNHALYREMTGRAIYLLREGKDKEEALQYLKGQYSEKKPVSQVVQEREIHEKIPAEKDTNYHEIMPVVMPLRKLKKFIGGRERRLRRGFRHRRIYFGDESGRKRNMAMGP